MNKVTELEAKVDANALALMVLVGKLHERGSIEAGAVAKAWLTEAEHSSESRPDAGYWLTALAGKLATVSENWPAPGTPRPW